MVALSSFSESVDEVGPSIASVSDTGGNSRMPWYLLAQDNGGAVSAADIQSAIAQIMGYCASYQAAAGRTRLSRVMPLSHPILPMMYASGISDIRGIGRPTKTVSGDLEVEIPSFPYYAQYPNYKFDVQFSTRSYLVRPDDAIPQVDMLGLGVNAQNGGWWVFPPHPQGQIPYRYAPEWWRYTDFEVMPQNESVTGVRDKMVFQTLSGDVPQNDAFAGMPRLFLPNSIIRFHWYNVPLRFITSPNSVITRYRGMVNQNAWYDSPEGKVFQPGELLYLSFTPKIYTSPIVALQTVNQGDVSLAKFCDLEFQFLYTKRVAGTITGTDNTDLPDPTNHNFIVAGHNLNPYFPKRAFYYCTFQSNDISNLYPSWLSFPFELLFTDPEAFPAQAP